MKLFDVFVNYRKSTSELSQTRAVGIDFCFVSFATVITDRGWSFPLLHVRFWNMIRQISFGLQWFIFWPQLAHSCDYRKFVCDHGQCTARPDDLASAAAARAIPGQGIVFLMISENVLSRFVVINDCVIVLLR